MGSAWMPREEWDALLREESCPMCADLAVADEENVYGYTIADLTVSRLRLCTNQFAQGYCVLICARHVTEPYLLSPAECAAFFDDLMRAARALQRVYAPLKMNYAILGNTLPHLHCHLRPRYYGDAVPGAAITNEDGSRILEPEEYRARVDAIRAVL
jgi:diadenosine tetraphosphate (Ap4A) HIT family hydrolase